MLALEPVKQNADRKTIGPYMQGKAMLTVLALEYQREAPHGLTASLAQALQVNDDGQNERNENDVRGLRHKLVCRPECRAG